jgi:hypothetical protein
LCGDAACIAGLCEGVLEAGEGFVDVGLQGGVVVGIDFGVAVLGRGVGDVLGLFGLGDFRGLASGFFGGGGFFEVEGGG